MMTIDGRCFQIISPLSPSPCESPFASKERRRDFTGPRRIFQLTSVILARVRTLSFLSGRLTCFLVCKESLYPGWLSEKKLFNVRNFRLAIWLFVASLLFAASIQFINRELCLPHSSSRCLALFLRLLLYGFCAHFCMAALFCQPFFETRRDSLTGRQIQPITAATIQRYGVLQCYRI